MSHIDISLFEQDLAKPSNGEVVRETQELTEFKLTSAALIAAYQHVTAETDSPIDMHGYDLSALEDLVTDAFRHFVETRLAHRDPDYATINGIIDIILKDQLYRIARLRRKTPDAVFAHGKREMIEEIIFKYSDNAATAQIVEQFVAEYECLLYGDINAFIDSMLTTHEDAPETDTQQS